MLMLIYYDILRTAGLKSLLLIWISTYRFINHFLDLEKGKERAGKNMSFLTLSDDDYTNTTINASNNIRN